MGMERVDFSCSMNNISLPCSAKYNSRGEGSSTFNFTVNSRIMLLSQQECLSSPFLNVGALIFHIDIDCNHYSINKIKRSALKMICSQANSVVSRKMINDALVEALHKTLF